MFYNFKCWLRQHQFLFKNVLSIVYSKFWNLYTLAPLFDGGSGLRSWNSCIFRYTYFYATFEAFRTEFACLAFDPFDYPWNPRVFHPTLVLCLRVGSVNCCCVYPKSSLQTNKLVFVQLIWNNMWSSRLGLEFAGCYCTS